jgi:glycosyltransferase involved in cell wall biosynthesis
MHIQLPAVALPFYPELSLARLLDGASARRLRAFAPDVIHCATEFTVGWSGTILAAQARIPLLTSYHTNFAQYVGAYGFAALENAAWTYLRRFHNRAALTLCPSQATLIRLREAGFRGPVEIWSRGVDANRFTPARKTAEARAALAPGYDNILLYVGRLAPEKRVDVLLEAFAQARTRVGSTALVLVGHGPAGDSLKEQAPPDVIFAGYRSGDALADAYAAADAFVFPSDTETFGNVVLEAAASGLPVLTVDAGGVTETVVHNETGLLVPPRDASALAKAMEELLSSHELRARLGAEGRRRAEGRTWTRILDSVIDSYRMLVADARGRQVA